MTENPPHPESFSQEEINSDSSAAHDIDSHAVSDYLGTHDINREVYSRWKTKAEAILQQNGQEFDYFCQNKEGLVKTGDEILARIEGTGYNVGRFDFMESDIY